MICCVPRYVLLLLQSSTARSEVNGLCGRKVRHKLGDEKQFHRCRGKRDIVSYQSWMLLPQAHLCGLIAKDACPWWTR